MEYTNYDLTLFPSDSNMLTMSAVRKPGFTSTPLLAIHDKTSCEDVMNYCDFLGSYCNFTFHGASYTRWRNAQTLENFEKYKSWSLS